MLKHYVLWGSTAEGMSPGESPSKAAYLDGGNIIIVSGSAIEENDLPPGFQRFLTDAECVAEGIEPAPA